MERKFLSKWIGLVATANLMAILFSGCAWQIGGDKHGTPAIHPTRGQELIDLKRAKDQGAITEDEYQAQRQKILGR